MSNDIIEIELKHVRGVSKMLTTAMNIDAVLQLPAGIRGAIMPEGTRHVRIVGIETLDQAGRILDWYGDLLEDPEFLDFIQGKTMPRFAEEGGAIG